MSGTVMGGESVDIQDGGHHLDTVRGDTAGDGKMRPVKVLLDSETKPQQTSLDKSGHQMSVWEKHHEENPQWK